MGAGPLRTAVRWVRSMIFRSDAGDQLHLPCPAAAAVVAHPGDDVADQHVRCAVCVSESTRSLPHRSRVIRMNHDGKALNGSSIAPLPVGSGSVP